MVHRINEGNRTCGVQKSVPSNRGLGINSKECLYKGVIVPMTLYRAEAGAMRRAERRLNVPAIKCLRSLVGVSQMDRVGNEEVRRRAEIERELTSRVAQRVLRFGHVERITEYWMTRRVLMAEVSGEWVRGRQRLGFMDGVKVALLNRVMTVEAERQWVKDRKEWRALVHCN